MSEANAYRMQQVGCEYDLCCYNIFIRIKSFQNVFGCSDSPTVTMDAIRDEIDAENPTVVRKSDMQ